MPKEKIIRWFAYCGINPEVLEEYEFYKQVPEKDRENWCCFVSYNEYLKALKQAKEDRDIEIIKMLKNWNCRNKHDLKIIINTVIMRIEDLDWGK